MGPEIFFNAVLLWLFGMLPAAPVMFAVGRFGSGSLDQRKRKAALRTFCWPATVLFALMDVAYVLFGKCADLGASGLMVLLTTSRDRAAAMEARDKAALLEATEEADTAEARLRAADAELQAFNNGVMLEEKDHEPVTTPLDGIPHGRVHYVEVSAPVRIGHKASSIGQFWTLKDSTLVWRNEADGVWHTVESMKDVPLGWPIWQVDREETAHRLLGHHVMLRFWGYNTEMTGPG